MNIILTLALIGSVKAIPANVLYDYKMVCRWSYTFEPLSRILERQEFQEDSDLSVGFHLDRSLCKEIGESDPKMPRAITAYFSDEAIVLFANIESTSENSVTTLNLAKIKSISKSNVSFTLAWMRTKTLLLDSPHIYTISYLSKDNNQKIIRTNDFRESLKNEEQILLKDIRDTKVNTQELNITLVGNQSTNGYSVDSFLILCLVSDKTDKKRMCEPIQVNDRGITCYCDPEYVLTTFLILLGFWCVTLLMSIKPMFDLIFDKKQKEQKDFPMAISCNQRTSKYEYLFAIRLAKDSADFDLKDVNIDLEFFSSNNESIAPVFRFKASVLEKELLTQIRIFMSRLTKLPELTKVQCSHSGMSDGRITLFGVYVFCRKGADDYRIYKVNRSIGRQNRIFPMIRENEREDKEEEVRLNTSNFDIKYSYLEVVWILFVNIAVISFTAAVFYWSTDSSATLLDMLITSLVSFSVAIVFNFVFLKVYQGLLLAELKQQSKMISKYETFLYVVIRVYYVISIVVSVGLGIYLGFSKIDRTDIETYKWFCITLFATSLLVLVWSIAHHINCPKSKGHSEPSDEGLSAFSID